jgi:stage V sporulation protein S
MATGPAAVPSDEAVGDAGAAPWEREERRPHVPAWAPPGDDDGHGAEARVLDAEAAPGAVANGQSNSEVLKVSARSRPSAVAGAIAGVVREVGRAEVQAIGAGATNQAVKAVAIARDYLRETGIEAICLPAFIDVTIENEDRTAIRLVVEPR